MGVKKTNPKQSREIKKGIEEKNKFANLSQSEKGKILLKMAKDELGKLKGISSSDLQVSNVITNLSRRVRDARVYKGDFKYILTRLFNRIPAFDGMIDIDYVELRAEEGGTASGKVTIDDFNAKGNKVARETVFADIEKSFKTRLDDFEIMNFLTNPTDTLKAVFTNSQNVDKQQELEYELAMWDKVIEKAYVIDCKGLPVVAEKGDSVAKIIFTVLKNMKTSSKIHPFIGEKGKEGIIKTIDGSEVQPTNRYNPEDMILITSVDYEADVIYEGNKVYLNYGSNSTGQTLQLNTTEQVKIDIYEGMSKKVKKALQDVYAIAIHKDYFVNVEDWDITKLNSGGHAYAVLINYLFYGIYARKDLPIIMFKKGEAPKNEFKSTEKMLTNEKLLSKEISTEEISTDEISKNSEGDKVEEV